MSRFVPVLLVALCAAPTAQTYVVDAANGPGTDYTSIGVAVAAVPDGATLLVRPGSYAGFTIHAKGLTVLGGPGVTVSQSFGVLSGIDIRNTLPAQSVTVRGFGMTGSCYGSARVSNCAGSVHLEDLSTAGGCATTSGPGATIGISSSMQVMVKSCSGFHSSAVNSNTVFANCSFTGANAGPGLGTSSEPGLSIDGGTTQLTGCTLSGGWGYPSLYPFNQPGLLLNGADVRLLAPCTITAGSEPWANAAAAIGGTGTLRVDPTVTLVTPQPPLIAAGVATQFATMPTVTSTSGSTGATIDASAIHPTGNLTVLLVGFAGPEIGISGIRDAFWIEPAGHHFAAIGVPQPSAPLTASIAIPNNAALRGTRVVWQSVTATASALQTSSPAPSLVR